LSFVSIDLLEKITTYHDLFGKEGAVIVVKEGIFPSKGDSPVSDPGHSLSYMSIQRAVRAYRRRVLILRLSCVMLCCTGAGGAQGLCGGPWSRRVLDRRLQYVSQMLFAFCSIGYTKLSKEVSVYLLVGRLYGALISNLCPSLSVCSGWSGGQVGVRRAGQAGGTSLRGGHGAPSQYDRHYSELGATRTARQGEESYSYV
jgi:hypothetical protein